MPVYIMFLLAGSAIYAPLINALTFIALINYMKLGAERIDALCKTPVLPEGIIEDVVNSEIEFRHVSFSYNADIPVLRDVSLTIPEKELTAFVGPSGSGKTTLTRLIARFWDVSEGEILFGGRNIKDYTVHTLMQQVSIVFQDVYLFNDTIYNNIRVGRETATREEIEVAARKAQCHNFITAMPDGYETMVGEGGSTLSGGEKQRISIARAILKDAPIVLLDEATASLDPENEVHIQDAINDLVKEKTVVIIAHRLGTVIGANNIVVIDQGRVVQQGKHQALLAEEGLYRNLWEEQQRVKGWKFKQSNKHKAMDTNKRKTGLARLIEIAGTKRRLLIGAMLLAVITAIVQFVPIIAVYNILIELAEHALDPSLIDKAYIWLWSYIALGAFFAFGVLTFASLMLSHIAAFNILYEIRMQLVQKMVRLPWGSFPAGLREN